MSCSDTGCSPDSMRKSGTKDIDSRRSVAVRGCRSEHYAAFENKATT